MTRTALEQAVVEQRIYQAKSFRRRHFASIGSLAADGSRQDDEC
jgi:hypothetical protein